MCVVKEILQCKASLKSFDTFANSASGHEHKINQVDFYGPSNIILTNKWSKHLCLFFKLEDNHEVVWNPFAEITE